MSAPQLRAAAADLQFAGAAVSAPPGRFHGLYRREAWDHHVSNSQRGRLLRLRPGASIAASWAVFALAVVAVAAGLVFHVDARAAGSAVVALDPSGAKVVEAQLPASIRGRLVRGAPLRFVADGHPLDGFDVVLDEVAVAAGDARFVCVRGRVPPGAAAAAAVGARGSAEVRVGTQPLLWSLLPFPRFPR